MRRAALSVVAVLLAVCAHAAPASRTFELRYRSAAEAAVLIGPLLSPEGSLTIEAKGKSVTVRDTSDVLRRVKEAIVAWDVVPQPYRVRLRVVLASREGPLVAPPATVAALAQDLQMFGFRSYEELDSLQLTATDGSSVSSTVSSNYHVKFTLQGVTGSSDRVQLKNLQFSKREPVDLSGIEPLRTLLSTNVSLKTGQTTVLAAARSEQANKVLLLVFSAEREAHP